jgi:pimeloyl-ACP methyl ester carboxylesterase
MRSHADSAELAKLKGKRQQMECIVRDIPIYYETSGSGFSIVMLHGYSPDHRLMQGCMEPLFAERPGWQRVYFDLPGMGQTPGPEQLTSTDEMLEVVLEFLEVVIGEQSFLLVGESYGGYLSLGVLQRKFEQVAGMALICPVVLGERSQRDRPPRTMLVEDASLMASLPAADAQQFGAFAVVQDASTWQRFREEVLPGMRIADDAFLQRLNQQYSYSFDVTVLPRPFSEPVVILVGRQDHIVGYRDAWRLLESYPRTTFAVLDRAGHNLQLEQPQVFNVLVGEWLDRVQESRKR